MSKKGLLPPFHILLLFITVVFSSTLVSASHFPSVEGKTLSLYDAASGAIPSTPLLSFTDFPPGVAAPSYSDQATIMDTTISGRDTYAGWIASGATTPGFPLLDRTVGFQVNFSVQVEKESHANNHRAGFSLIILGQDAKGVEIAFWQNQIWAQSDDKTGGLFRHGEGVAFKTSSGLVDYQVTILDDTYTLTANTQSILTGPLRDYSKFEGFPDPYQTPNFLFVGDDTTSAASRVRLSFLSVTGTEPVTPTANIAITSTSVSSPTPQPTESPTPVPSLTPLPSPTPVSKSPGLCPSSGLLVMMIIGVMLIKRKGRV